MALVKFYLKKPSSEEKSSLIYLVLDYDGKRFKYSTGEKVRPSAWNTNKQRVKRPYSGSAEINNYLEYLATEVLKIYREALTTIGVPRTAYLREKLNTSLHKDTKGGTDFFDIFDQFVEARVALVSQGTTKKFLVLKKHLQDFEATWRSSLSFDTLTHDFYEAFVSYFVEELGSHNDTIGKNIAALKTFLNWATDRKLNNNIDYTKFKVLTQETDIVYLEDQELNQLYTCEDTSERLNRIRDVFCFCCFTGLRFSDLQQLSPDSVTGDTLVFTTQKTRDKLFVPLSSRAKAILTKYKNTRGFLPVVSNQKMNEYIKELGEKAGVTSPVTITRFSGKNRIVETKPKYQFLTCHTARRTFITLSLEKNVRAEVVMAIVGHKQYKTLQRYLKITDKVKKRELLSAWG